MVKKVSSSPSKLEQHRAAVKAVTPAVETLAKEHGLAIVHAAVTKLYERRKLRKKAEELRKAIADIESQL